MGVLAGKVAIVTGAAQGQGAAEARLFHEEGAKVVLTDVNRSGSDLADQLGEGALFMRHDVSDESEWSQVVRTTLERFGRIDILVNNAGIYRPQPIQMTDAELMDLHYRVNQLGVFLGMKAVIDAMTQVGGGSIINISSQAGLQGAPGMLAYSTSKWAVRGLTRCAAADLASLNIRVNSVHPGLIDTPMLASQSKETTELYRSHIPLGRMGTANDIAQTVLFLASDASSYTTGAELAVAGGVGI